MKKLISRTEETVHGAYLVYAELTEGKPYNKLTISSLWEAAKVPREQTNLELFLTDKDLASLSELLTSVKSFKQ